jgi:hypothetical protein
MRYNVMVLGAVSADWILAAHLCKGVEQTEGTGVAIPTPATEVQHGRL